jgi:photosynthetic reaction center H subunit
MQTGAITGYIDVAQLTLYLFWLFFAGLVYYLHRENKREGYPLSTSSRRRGPVVGFPDMPAPKTYTLLNDQGTREVPRPDSDAYELAAAPTSGAPGSPLYPTGNPMRDGVGPAAWATRPEVPDLTVDGNPKIVPMRVATEFSVESRDPDPRGKPVYGADRVQAGEVSDIWVDRSEPQIRYLEVAVADSDQRVLLPITFARVRASDGSVHVRSILAQHFADVPTTASPDQVTLQEEDKICAYYGGGTLYALPQRQEPASESYGRARRTGADSRSMCFTPGPRPSISPC